MKTGKRVLSLLLVAALLLSTSVAVFAETVLAIDIATLPTKLTYAEWEALDVTGGELTVYYSGSQEVIPITEDMVTGFDSTVLGTQTLTVSYAGAVCTYDVLITPKPASAISVTTLPAKLTYLEGKDTLDVTGGKLTVSYTDGTPDKIISMTLDMVTGFDNTIVGTQTLTVSYAEQTTTFQVEIQAKTLAELTLAQTPTKTIYLLGEEVLDITGGQIRLIYNNDTSEIVDMTADMVSGFDGNTAGVQTITVSYGGLTTTYQIEVFETEVVSISVAKLPDVTKYLLDMDDVDVTGGEITVKYYNDTTAIIPMTAEMVSGYDNTILGEQTLTVTYAEKTTTFTVEISRNNTIEFLGGLGTVNRPYIIKTKEHLNNVRNYLDAHYMMIADIEFTEADFAEDGAFYNSGEGWQPIGTSSAPFSGYFDGNGHAIKGLQSNISSDSTVYAGLFGYVKNCTIRNLGMVDTCIEGTSTSDDNNAYAGGIVGSAYNSTITNCYNTGNVTATATSTYSSSYAYAGGIVGYTSGSTINDCYNTGSVTATASSSSSYADVYAGGIVGYVHNGSTTTITDCNNTGSVTSTSGFFAAYAGGIVGYVHNGSTTTITDCYNTGSVTATATSTSGFSDAYAGGIVGDAYSSAITNCYNTGSVTATATSTSISYNAYAGGIVGRAYEGTTITNCNNTGSVTAKTTSGNSHANAGGIVGYVHNGSTTTITDCYNTGCVTAKTTSSSCHAGGIVGYTSGSTINDCYNTGSVTATASSSSSYADVYAGGVVGYTYNSTITNCYNTGSVTATSISTSSSSHAYAYAGGIVGRASSSTTITDCYNTGSVTATASSSSSYANAYVGGIVGRAYGGTTNIIGCYNTGSVTVSATSGSCYAGGIVGDAYSTTITDCYNTGSVTATSISTSSSSHAYAYAGGIVGCAYEGTTITNCNNTGSVTATASCSSSYAYAYVGGIVGETESSTITDCYNTGSVMATATSTFSSSRAHTGGIVGYAGSGTTITNCYYLNIISKGVGYGTDTATACTVAQMKQQETFAGFDFDTVWTMEGHEDFLFPELQTVPMVFTDSVVDVSIETLPDKLTFAEGVSLDVSGGMLKVSYLGGKVIEVPLEVSMVTGFDNSAPGEQILTVTYAGKTTTFTVTVTHSNETEWSQDETYHWHACSACGDKTDYAEHVYDNACDTTCNVCGYTRTITHSFGNWAVTEEPTCTEKGEETRTCATCGKTETREVEALGHDYKAMVTDPTCAEQGYTTHTCARCDDSYVDTYVEALGHDLGAWAETKAATCTEKGAERRDCSRCKYYETREVEALGHDYKATVTDPTCTEQGYTTHTCSRCDDSYVDTYVEALGHDFGEWTETKAATCTEKGAERRDCSRCEHYETREVEALGHDYKATVTDPTCTEQGYTAHTCARCNDSYVDTYVDALGHDYKDTVTAPTCTERGYTAHTCTRCDDSYVDTYVEALGHDLGAWTETKAATCTGKGAERRDCSRCEYYETREVEAFGHDYKATVTDPTCTEQGYTTHTCTRCNDSYVDTYVAALDHAWDAGEVTKQPTETEQGEKIYTCTRCGATKAESIPATGGQTDKPCDGSANCPSKKFVDVSAKDWFHEAVDFAVKQGLFGGMSANTFEPNTPMTRAMLVTVLWRYEGEIEAPANTFSDVKAGTWYADAVSWAAANSIVGGVGNNKFDPDGNITREQMATILYRYCNGKGIDTSKQGSLSGFPDAEKASSSAKVAMQWAVAEGLINGSDGKLQPQGNATRAQVATILMRFIENIV